MRFSELLTVKAKSRSRSVESKVKVKTVITFLTLARARYLFMLPWLFELPGNGYCPLNRDSLKQVSILFLQFLSIDEKEKGLLSLCKFQ
jgi:hypothetical protein